MCPTLFCDLKPPTEYVTHALLFSNYSLAQSGTSIFFSTEYSVKLTQ